MKVRFQFQNQVLSKWRVRPQKILWPWITLPHSDYFVFLILVREELAKGAWKASETVMVFLPSLPATPQLKCLFNSSMTFTYVYSRITSTKSPSFCIITLSASLTNLTLLLLQSQNYIVPESKYFHLGLPETPWSTDTKNSRTLPTCDISVG